MTYSARPVPRDEILSALANPQVTAFRHVLAGGETSAAMRPQDYGAINGGGQILDFSAHPWDGIPTTQGAKACGAYQYLGTTWASYRERYDIPDFSPASQDFVACADICEHRVVPAIESGDLASAMLVLGNEWVSLQTMSLDRARGIFTQYGGTLSAAEPAPTPTKAPMGALALPLLQTILPSVIGLFSQKAQAQISKTTGASPDAAAAFFQNLMGQVSKAAGIPIPDDPVAAPAAAIQAVAEVTKPANVAKVAQIEESSVEYLNHLMPVLDKLATYEQAGWTAEEASRDAAAERGAKQAEGPLFNNPTFIIAAWIMFLVGFVVFSVLYKDAMFKGTIGFSTDMQAFVIGAIVGGALTAVVSFYLGSSRSSAAKDVVIGEMARRKAKE